MRSIIEEMNDELGHLAWRFDFDFILRGIMVVWGKVSGVVAQKIGNLAPVSFRGARIYPPRSNFLGTIHFLDFKNVCSTYMFDTHVTGQGSRNCYCIATGLSQGPDVAKIRYQRGPHCAMRCSPGW